MGEAQQLTLDLHERIYYDTRKPVTVRELTESLLALEKLVKQAPPVLTALTGVEVLHVELLVEEIHSGSLIENVIIRMFFGSEEKLNEWLDKRHKQLGDGKMRDGLIAAVVAGMIAAAMVWITKTMQSGPGPTTTIEANNNIIFNIGASETVLTPEQFRTVVEAAVKDRKEIAKSSIKVLAPAKADPQGSLTIGSAADARPLHFPAAVIQQTPATVTFEPEQTEQSFSDVDLQLRAMDLDSKTRGWGGLIPNLISRRVRIQLDPDVDPRKLANRLFVRADLTVKYKPDPKKSGSILPTLIVVHRVIGDDEGGSTVTPTPDHPAQPAATSDSAGVVTGSEADPAGLPTPASD